MSAAKYWSVFMVIAVLGGCAVGPDYHTPATTMPSAFNAAPPTTQPANITDWWKSFGDPELDSLIERALAANFDLDIALTRLQEARTTEEVVEGGALPE